MSEKKCGYCGADQLEKVGDDLICKRCGLGFGLDGKPMPNAFQILQEGVTKMKMLKQLFFVFHLREPTHKELQNLYAFHAHRSEKHPTTKGGYCEFCERNWIKMSTEKFKEETGYERSHWFNEDGTPKENRL
jgi:hypothetical protein